MISIQERVIIKSGSQCGGMSPLAPDREMVKKFDTIAKRYIFFTSFLWAFTWCFLKLESYGAL